MRSVVLLLLSAGVACSSDRAPVAGSGSGSASARESIVYVKTDTVIDLDAWRAGCDRGDVSQCELLANQYSISPDPARVAESVAIFERACAAKSLLGCYAAGAAYADGKGVPADPARGLALLRTGCELGHHWACERLKP